MPVCVVFGDSNSHGTPPIEVLGVDGRHQRADRWPNVMGDELGSDWEVITDGLPGRTTVHDDPIEGGARSGVAVLPSVLHAHKPIDLLMIMLGTNDLKCRFSVSGTEIVSSVGRLVREAQASGVVGRIMIVAPVPVTECGTLKEVFQGAEQKQDGTVSRLKELAQSLGCGFLAAGEVAEVSPVDGVHLEVSAHHALGKAAASAVRKYWKECHG